MSFDFQNLEVYKKSKTFRKSCKQIVKANKLDSFRNDQLGRASFRVALNNA